MLTAITPIAAMLNVPIATRPFLSRNIFRFILFGDAKALQQKAHFYHEAIEATEDSVRELHALQSLHGDFCLLAIASIKCVNVTIAPISISASQPSVGFVDTPSTRTARS